MFGGIAAVLRHGGCFYALPLNISIQDGLSVMASWDSSSASRAPSHVIQMVRNGYEAASSLGLSYLVLDRYFLSVPALMELDRLNRGGRLLDIITYRFVKNFLPKSRKKLHIIITIQKEERADKAQIYLHFTSPVFGGIIVKLYKRGRMFALTKHILPTKHRQMKYTCPARL